MAQLVGKVVSISPVERGTSNNGDWVRGGFAILPLEGDAKPVYLSLFGEGKINMLVKVKVGMVVIVQYQPESREYNGKWFTDLRCWRLQFPLDGKEVQQ